MASSDQASPSITFDESHPFFLHHVENPGAILVSQPLIGGENYPTWARSMERALRIKNKFWLIDGSTSLTSAMEKVLSWFKARHDAMILWFLGSSIVFLPGLPQAWCIIRLPRKSRRSFRTCFLRVMDLGFINYRRISQVSLQVSYL